MSKMLLAVSLLTAVSACNKKNDFSRFEDYGIASVSWSMVSEIGTLQVFQGGDFVSHNPASSGQATNRVECLAFDEPGNLWVSTGLDAPTFDLKHEVSLYNQKNWLVLSKEIKGFPNLRVTAIAIRSNTVWMATALGLLKVQLEYQ